MPVHLFFFIYACLLSLPLTAQSEPVDTAATKLQLLRLNQSLDNAVVQKQAAVLQKHYAPDFYFLHGTGQIDSKKSWMHYVLDSGTQYLSRTYDSVQVELHADVAVIAGILTVKRSAPAKTTGYALRYIRVYALRKNTWRLLSHRTTQEWQLPDEPR